MGVVQAAGTMGLAPGIAAQGFALEALRRFQEKALGNLRVARTVQQEALGLGRNRVRLPTRNHSALKPKLGLARDSFVR